jgi:hypothetical protein
MSESSVSATEIVTRPYEVLFRFQPDGTIAGHCRYIREVRIDGAIESARELPPIALTLSSPEFAGIVDRIDAGLLAECDRLNSELQALRSRTA